MGQGYNGHLDYELTASALEIHTLVAEPPGSKLGAFLVWICANTASFNRKNEIKATSTARSAMPFLCIYEICSRSDGNGECNGGCAWNGGSKTTS
jgi:hypothetical protein